MSSEKYAIGMLFPEQQFKDMRGGVIHFTQSGFEVLYLVEMIQFGEFQAFKREKITYGLFIESYIPFITLSFGKEFKLACPFDIFKMNPDQANDWLRRRKMAGDMYLIEKISYILRARRIAKFHSSFMSDLEACLLQQKKIYTEAVSEPSGIIENMRMTHSIEHMIQNSKQYK